MANSKKDSLWIGLATGLIGPALIFWTYYFVKFSHVGAIEYLQYVVGVKLLSPMISLSLIINLGVFFLFIRLNADRSARGVLLATFLYGAVIILTKFSG